MMYYLNKIVGWTLSPFGILFLGMALAGVLGLLGKVGKALGKVITALTLIFTWVMSSGITTRLIGTPLEGEEAQISQDMAEVEADAIVLLGGGMGEHKKCSRAEMFSGADRVWHAAKVWKRTNGTLPITLSGGGVEISTIPFLEDLGVTRAAMRLFPDARNTEEEAAMIAQAIKAEKGQGENSQEKPRIFLVTSAWHMPRSKMLFERAGFEVIEEPTDYEMHFAAEEELKFADFLPNAEAALRNSYALKEWVARFGYAIFRK